MSGPPNAWRWTRAAACLLLAAAILGCGTSPSAPEPPAGDPLTDPDPPPDAPGHGEAVPPSYRSATGWEDDSEGPLTTVVYLTASGTREEPRPYPVILASDPSNTYFHRESGPGISVRRLYKREMARLLERLRAEGLESLPWEPFGLRERIGPERGLYLYQDGTCRHVLKARLDTEARKTFTRVENRLIALTGS